MSMSPYEDVLVEADRIAAALLAARVGGARVAEVPAHVIDRRDHASLIVAVARRVGDQATLEITYDHDDPCSIARVRAEWRWMS